MSTPTAVLYARVSSSDQAEEEVSVPAQIEAGERKSVALNAKIVRTYKDEGRTAFKEESRPRFEEAVDYAVTHGVTYFLTWSSSRFARNKFEAVTFKRDLERAGVKLIYLSVNIDLSTDEGWLLDSMFEIMDEQRSRDTSKDTKRSLIYNAEQGYWVGGLAPFGYVSVPAPDNPKRRKLLVLPEEADMVREVFALRISGLGGKSIAVRFNSQSVRYRGRDWNKATVIRLLQNPAMIGQTVFNRVDSRTKRAKPEHDWLVLNTHEPIIKQETWLSVRGVMARAAETCEARGYSKSSHAFTGLLRCGICGGTLVIETGRGNGGSYSYYICRRGRNDDACTSTRYPAGQLDDYLNQTIFDRLLSQETLQVIADNLIEHSGTWARDRKARRQTLAAQIQDIRTRNAKLFEIMEKLGADTPNLGDLTSRLRDNNANIKGLEQEMAAIDVEPAPSSGVDKIDLSTLGEEIRSLFADAASVERLRGFYQTFIRGVTLRTGSADIEYEPGRLIAAQGPSVQRNKHWGG